MDSSDNPVAGWMLFLLFIVINSIFYGFGSAIQNLNENEIEDKAEQGDRKSKLLLHIMNAPGSLIQTVQFYHMLLSFLVGYVQLKSIMKTVSISLSATAAGVFFTETPGKIILCILVLFVDLILLATFGILVPKRICSRHAAASAYRMVHMVQAGIILAWPITKLMELLTNLTVRLFGIDPNHTEDDVTEDEIIDTMIPATTDVSALCHQYEESEKNGLQLFFSTYQSINVIHDFQQKSGLQFDLVICDEAHRTTGVTLAGEDDSNFVRVHDDEYIHAKKRLYMTATPRIYADASKQKAKDNSALLCSMDDESIYGPEFYRLSFSDAVSQGLLSDYKVVVLAVDEEFVSRSLQKQLTDSNNELTLDDAVKIVGCMNGLAKKTHFPGEENYFSNDPQPMRRAVAFTQTIEQSKKFVAMFEEIQALYKINTNDGRNHTVELKHVDGSFNALERKNRIEWLKQDTGEDSCRVLSNARCLSEGVDVPALDAVMFLNPRKSILWVASCAKVKVNSMAISFCRLVFLLVLNPKSHLLIMKNTKLYGMCCKHCVHMMIVLTIPSIALN